MTKELVEFTMENGGVIIVESTVDDLDDTDFQRVSRSKDDAEVIKAKRTWGDALSQLKPATQLLFNALSELNQPAQIELEFGVKVGAKAGVVLASADSEVTFKVKLAWTNK